MKVTNISGGLLVCTLANGKTLRLDNKKSTDLPDSAITPYLEGLSKRGYVRMKSTPRPTNHTVEKTVKKENKKEVDNNGNV